MKDLTKHLRNLKNEVADDAADMLERIYSQPVELPEADLYRHDFVDEETDFEVFDFKSEDCGDCKPLYTADQLTKAVQEATARALEAAAKECKELDNDENSSDYRAASVWCAERIHGLIGRVK